MNTTDLFYQLLIYSFIYSSIYSSIHPLIHAFIYLFTAELGDYDPDIHTAGFVSEFRFCPGQTEAMEEDIVEKFKEYGWVCVGAVGRGVGVGGECVCVCREESLCLRKV